jgi:hypothetical protein
MSAEGFCVAQGSSSAVATIRNLKYFAPFANDLFVKLHLDQFGANLGRVVSAVLRRVVSAVVCSRFLLSFAKVLLSLLVSPAEPLPLMDLCRRSVRLALGKERLGAIPALPLPASLKAYLLYQ